MKGKLKGIRGEVLTFKADPFVCGAAECYDHYEDGLVVMCDGLIVAVGDYAATAAAWPELTDIDVWSDSLITAGVCGLSCALCAVAHGGVVWRYAAQVA